MTKANKYGQHTLHKYPLEAIYPFYAYQRLKKHALYKQEVSK
jgi:hypothetical protein